MNSNTNNLESSKTWSQVVHKAQWSTSGLSSAVQPSKKEDGDSDSSSFTNKKKKARPASI